MKFIKAIVALLTILPIVLSPTQALALSAAQKGVFDNGINYFNVDDGLNDGLTSSCSASGDTGTTTGSSTTPSNGSKSAWSSGVQAPYYTEEYVINVLKDIAQVEGVPESSTVTQEHVVAMVAWAYLEGGNIANTGADFNLWNMGFLKDDPQLYRGQTGNADGSQTAFASFDAGVQGNTIEMTDSLQGRIGTILSQPNSTAEQVMHAISYPDETTGNEPWAWGPAAPGSSSPTLQSAVAWDHTSYINSLLSVLSATRSDYANRASFLIGPGEEGKDHVDASLLQYKGGAGSSTGSGGSGTTGSTGDTGSSDCPTNTPINSSTDCTTVTGDPKILCEAQKYQGIYYEYGGAHGVVNSGGLAAFLAACPDPSNPPNNQPTGGPINGDPDGKSGNPSPCATDCSSLVSIALDEAFNKNYMWSVATSMQGADGDLWRQIDISQATAGDIVTTSEHVEIVDHVDNKTDTVYTFGSHSTLTQTGPISSPFISWPGGAWRWYGAGSGLN